MSDYILITIIFLAAFSKSLSGFSFGLITMSFLPHWFEMKTVIPLISILQLITSIILWLYYRRHFNIKIVFRLVISSIVGVPIGVFALKNLDTTFMLNLLGIGIIFYSFYCLFTPKLPQPILPQWAYLFGFFSGLFSGAYNLSGPPIIVYANSSHWNNREFKSNILGVFIITEIITVIERFLSQSFTDEVWQLFGITIFPLCLGILLGIMLSEKLNQAIFQKIVLLLLIFSGVKLIF